MNRLLRIVLSAALVLAAVSTRAAEGGAGTVYPKAQYPYAELVKQPLTLSAGLIRVDVPVEINLTKDQVGEPWNIPLSADFGVTDDLQVGIFHVTGLCLAGEDNGCPNAYDDIGARARYSLHRDPGGQLVLDGGLAISSFDASTYEAIVGAAYKRTMGNLALELDAAFQFGLNKRDERVVKDVYAVGAELQFQVAHGLAAFGNIAFADAIDEDVPYAIPVGFGVEYEIVPRVDVGAEFTFENLLGEDSTADERSAAVFVRLFL